MSRPKPRLDEKEDKQDNSIVKPPTLNTSQESSYFEYEVHTGDSIHLNRDAQDKLLKQRQPDDLDDSQTRQN